MLEKKNIRRISVILLILMLFQTFTNLYSALAVSVGESKYLSRGRLSDYIVQFNNGSYWTYISSNIVTYEDPSDINRVAYCVTPGVPRS